MANPFLPSLTPLLILVPELFRSPQVIALSDKDWADCEDDKLIYLLDNDAVSVQCYTIPPKSRVLLYLTMSNPGTPISTTSWVLPPISHFTCHTRQSKHSIPFFLSHSLLHLALPLLLIHLSPFLLLRLADLPQPPSQSPVRCRRGGLGDRDWDPILGISPTLGVSLHHN